MSDMPKGFKQTEVGLIPEDWDAAPITEVILESNGIKIGPFGSQLKKELLTKDGYKVYGQENVYENTMEIGTRYISREHFLKLSSCEIKSGDFLISMMGTIGKCMIVPDCFEQGIMDSHLIRLRLNSNKLNSELLLHFFASNHLQAQVKKYSVGGIMDGLSSKIVKQLQIPLPPNKTEQTAIAAALNDADALITALEKLIAKKKAIKQGAMQELLKPKAGWEANLLGKIADVKMGQSPLSAHYNTQGIGLPLIQGNADIKNRQTIIRTYTSIITKRGIKGDIIMSVRAPVGEISKATFDCCLGIWVCSITYENNYLYHYLVFFENSWGKFSTGSTFDSVTGKQVRELEILLPNTKQEEYRIATILSDMDSEIETLEQKLEKQKQIKQGMMQVLLTGKVRLV